MLNNVTRNNPGINPIEYSCAAHNPAIKKPRFLKEYRSLLSEHTVIRFSLCWKYSDIIISVDKENWNDTLPCLALTALKQAYDSLEAYDHPEWFSSFSPLDAYPDAPPLVQRMSEAARDAHVGPMAAVAGAIADKLLETLSNASTCTFCAVENGGDCAIISTRTVRVALASESTVFQGRIALELPPGRWGIATSSGSVGHSINFGKTDSCTIVSNTGALADAWATRCSNEVRDRHTLEQTALLVDTAPNIDAFFACIGEHMCYKGRFKLLPGGTGI